MASYEDFAVLEKQYPRTVSNDYMMPGDIRRRMESGKLTFTADEHALFLFEQREGFCKLHFRLIDTHAELSWQNKDALSSYLMYREGRYPDAAAGWLIKQGFVKTKTLRRYTATHITGELLTDGIDRASADETYEILREHFSAVEADMPCRHLFDYGLCVRSREGKPLVLGILYNLGQTVVIAVAPQAQGQGIGRRLYRAYAAGRPENFVFHEWISPSNSASIAMFQSLGFVPDAALTDCYVYKGV